MSTRSGLPSKVAEEIVGREAAWLANVVARAVQRVRARLDADAGHAALGVAELGVVGRGLDFEFLDDVSRRNVRRDHLVGVVRGSARRAVNRQVAAIGPGPCNCEADNV